jgi:polysaccharide biosynthesis protein PslE
VLVTALSLLSRKIDMRTQATGISLRDFYRIIFRHKKKAIFFFLLVSAATLLYAWFAPRTYWSEGKLFVRLGRENVGLDPTATLGQGPVVAVPQSREDEINSVVDLLHSRALVEKVVDQLGPHTILDLPGLSVAPTAFSSEIPMREQAVIKFEKSLDIAAVKKTNVIRVGYSASNPELAQKIVSQIMDCYLAEHVRMNRTPHAHQFLDDQTRRVHEELAAAETQLRDLQNQTGLASPREQRELLVKRISSLREELSATERMLESSIAEARLLRRSLSGLDNLQVTVRSNGLAIENKATEEVRRELYTLQMKEKELLAKYTGEHYLVVQIKEQIKSTKDMLTAFAGLPGGVAADPNAPAPQPEPGYALGESPRELIEREPALAALAAKAESLRGQVTAAEHEMQAFNEHGFQIAKLQREIDLLDASYRKYASNREQSRIDDSMQAERISNLSVVQPATINHKAVSPKRALILIGGLLAAIGGAIGLALVAEYVDHTCKTPEDVEFRLGLPTLATIPRFDMRRASLANNN